MSKMLRSVSNTLPSVSQLAAHNPMVIGRRLSRWTGTETGPSLARTLRALLSVLNTLLSVTDTLPSVSSTLQSVPNTVSKTLRSVANTLPSVS